MKRQRGGVMKSPIALALSFTQFMSIYMIYCYSEHAGYCQPDTGCDGFIGSDH